MALRVASLVTRPDDDLFHFGYAAYEPMLNLTKGLLMGFVSLFALVSSIADAIQGGREVSAGWALIYAVIASALHLEVEMDTKIRIQQVGRFTYTQLYVVCRSDPEGGIRSLDCYRDDVAKALAGEFGHLAMDIVFTRDPRWVAVSVGNSEMTSHCNL